jgi:hypothetical protein
VYTVRDRGRPLDFDGVCLGADNSYSDHKGRWFEVRIFKTLGGKYVVAGVGRSRVVHKQSCSRVGNAKLKQVDGRKTHDGLDLMPCDICRPVLGEPNLVKEQDREWAQVSEEPEAVIERLRLRDSDGVWYVPTTSTRALEAAAQADEGIKRALFAPQHID